MSVENFNQLPDEVICAILSKLDWKTRVCMERVCKRWQRMAQKVWQSEEEIDFTGFGGKQREYDLPTSRT